MTNEKFYPDYDKIRNMPFEEFMQSWHEDEAAVEKAITAITDKMEQNVSETANDFVEQLTFRHVTYPTKWFNAQPIDAILLDKINAAEEEISAFDLTEACYWEEWEQEEWKNIVRSYCEDIEYTINMVYNDAEENVAPFMDYCEFCFLRGDHTNLAEYEAIRGFFEGEEEELTDEDTYEDYEYSAISANSNNVADSDASTTVEENTEEEITMTTNIYDIINKTNPKTLGELQAKISAAGNYFVWSVIHKVNGKYADKWSETQTILSNADIGKAIVALNDAIEKCHLASFDRNADEGTETCNEYCEAVWSELFAIEDALNTTYNDISKYGDINPFIDYCSICCESETYVDVFEYEKIRVFFENNNNNDNGGADKGASKDKKEEKKMENSNNEMVKENNEREENEMTRENINISNIKPGMRIKLVEMGDLRLTKLQPGSTGTVTNVSVTDGVIAMEWDNCSKNYYLIPGVDKFEIIDDKPSADVINNVKPGTRIRLNKMNEVINAVPVPGSTGTVMNVWDDVINVYWDNDARTCITPGVDEFEIRKTDSHGMTLERGARIKLVKRNDPQPAKVPSGCMGTVLNVYDDFIDMKWDNGSRICLVPGYDHFEIVNNDNKGTNEGALENKKEEPTMDNNNTNISNIEPGTRVRLTKMNHAQIAYILVPGSTGTVVKASSKFIYVIWDNGYRICLKPGTDEFEIVQKVNATTIAELKAQVSEAGRCFVDAYVDTEIYLKSWINSQFVGYNARTHRVLDALNDYNSYITKWIESGMKNDHYRCLTSDFYDALENMLKLLRDIEYYDTSKYGDIKPFIDYCTACWDTYRIIDFNEYEVIKSFFENHDHTWRETPYRIDYSVEGAKGEMVRHIRYFDSETALFSFASELYAFDDCRFIEVHSIKCNGTYCKYTGWQRGMLFTYVNTENGEVVWECEYPEFNH